MGQVGVVIIDHMITYTIIIMFTTVQIQIMSVGVQLNPVFTISGDEVCESFFTIKSNNEILPLRYKSRSMVILAMTLQYLMLILKGKCD